MFIRPIAALAGPLALLGLSACGPSATTQTDEGTPHTLPESVSSIAAPYQDFASAHIKSDGCYWYRHEGPVETTDLPLRTPEGNPICTRPQG